MSTNKSKRGLRQTNRPEYKVGPFHGGIGVAVWFNTVENSKGEKVTMRSITIAPGRYRDPETGQWKDAPPTGPAAPRMFLSQGECGIVRSPGIIRSTTMHTESLTANSEAAIWERVIQPDRSNLSPEAARSILQLSFDQRDRDRMHALALKAQAGTLTPKDQQDLDNYRRVGRLLDLMKSKARLSLKKHRSPA
jgi:hypothetical protein